VLLKDDNIPPLKWQLGCILDVIPGDNNIAKVAMVRAATGLNKRVVAKLAVLPVDEFIMNFVVPKFEIKSR